VTIQSEYIKLTDAAREIGVSRWTLRRWSDHPESDCPPSVSFHQTDEYNGARFFNRVEWNAYRIRHDRRLAQAAMKKAPDRGTGPGPSRPFRKVSE
jgi:hypothetical protein